MQTLVFEEIRQADESASVYWSRDPIIVVRPQDDVLVHRL
jgi:hypothetical protein